MENEMETTFDIKRANKINEKSFRVAQVFDQFDLQPENLIERFSGKFEIPEVWNVGVIVGKSGTGKTTIAKELFSSALCNFTYNAESMIDDFDKSLSFTEITSVLGSVGFSSPPSWVKPYRVLSNGEKMRVDLARAILSGKDIIAFDEFTSVVDREVAKLGSFALQKAIRKNNKRFIAISCHYDILDWLEPDWIFYTDDMKFEITRGLLRRPEIKLDIRKTRGNWRYFSKYHYLSHSFSSVAQEFTAYINEKPVAFCAFISYPHNQHRHMKMIHRIVVLPDYQGIGIAQRLLNFVCNWIKTNTNADYISLVTSLNGFAKSIYKNKYFRLVSQGRKNLNDKKSLNKSSSAGRNTYSFKYIGEK